MKKILLGTTGLVGAALIASAASAETPKVTLGGFSDFQAGYTDNDLADSSDVGFRNDNEITVRVDGKTDAGLGYGAVIDLEADVTADNNNEGTNASRTFTYLEGGWGRVELGSNKSAASTMRVDASTLAVATGGINGDWVNFVTAAGTTAGVGGVLGTGFVTNSELEAEHGDVLDLDDESTYNATKVTYYTPRYAGFQAGVSYTPDVAGRGQVAARNNTVAQDAIELGLGYETSFENNTKLALAGTYLTAEGATGFDDAEGWNAGALLGIWGFNFAGSYGQWTEIAQTAANDEADYWTAGVGYDLGAFGLSATYLQSTVEAPGVADSDFDNLVLGADYKLAPGLTPYAEVSFYEFDAAGAANDNDGTTVILGTQLAF
ncbi:MAG: hypothetical protein DI582_03560 [Azospirillum brasilense]|nr:MAG: hypothetical protein DI582_03560 [Azospirillum brasilense]